MCILRDKGYWLWDVIVIQIHTVCDKVSRQMNDRNASWVFHFLILLTISCLHETVCWSMSLYNLLLTGMLPDITVFFSLSHSIMNVLNEPNHELTCNTPTQCTHKEAYARDITKQASFCSWSGIESIIQQASATYGTCQRRQRWQYLWYKKSKWSDIIVVIVTQVWSQLHGGKCGWDKSAKQMAKVAEVNMCMFNKVTKNMPKISNIMYCKLLLKI